MKSLVLLLACMYLPMQTVYYLDCCCGDFCTHKNACSGCDEDQTKPCEVHPNPMPEGDCCKDQDKPVRPQHAPPKKACSHVSPSTEVTVQAVDQAPPPMVWGEVVFDLPPIQPFSEAGVAAFLTDKVPRPAGNVPLHLILSVLQV